MEAAMYHSNDPDTYIQSFSGKLVYHPLKSPAYDLSYSYDVPYGREPENVIGSVKCSKILASKLPGVKAYTKLFDLLSFQVKFCALEPSTTSSMGEPYRV
jgi:hypothetical protein